jgi:hypothetical protein
VHSLQVTRETDEIRESAKGYREIMDDRPSRVNGNHKKIAGRKKTLFASQTKVTERQASGLPGMNTRTHEIY